MAYFPNGSAGAVLDEQCQNCPLGFGWNNPDQTSLFPVEREPKSCPVALVQMSFNYDQIDAKNKQLREAITMLVNNDGVCQVRELLVQDRKEQS